MELTPQDRDELIKSLQTFDSLVLAFVELMLSSSSMLTELSEKVIGCEINKINIEKSGDGSYKKSINHDLIVRGRQAKLIIQTLPEDGSWISRKELINKICPSPTLHYDRVFRRRINHMEKHGHIRSRHEGGFVSYARITDFPVVNPETEEIEVFRVNRKSNRESESPE